MSPSFASRLVRGWVSVYTSGLPAEARVARGDEIESDLWSQHQEAARSGRSDGSLAGEILARLVLGMAADVAWRLDHGRAVGHDLDRTATTGTRITSLLAVSGGLSLVAAMAYLAVLEAGNPDPHPYTHSGSVLAILGILGILGVSLALGGLSFAIVNRFESVVGLFTIVGAIGGICGMLGMYAALGLLPAASALGALYLAGIHVIRWPVALVHTASAPGLMLSLAAYSDSSLVPISTVLDVIYALTWIAIGLELWGGLPTPAPSMPPARRKPS